MKKRKDFLVFDEYSKFRKIIRIMKLTTFILLVTTMAVSASSYSQSTKLSLKFTEISYEKMFHVIEDQTEFRFAFSNSKLDSNQKIEVDVKKKTLEEILDKTLPEGITYEVIDRYVIIMDVSEKSTAGMLQQQKTVTGTVTNDSGDPMPGVNVFVKGTTRGTITDQDGKYSISLQSGDDVLVFSFIGMKKQEIVIGGKSTIDVSMESEFIGLDEVVSIGYGSQKKSLVSGAISSIKEDELSNISSNKIDQVLQGRMAGVQVSSNSGMPGAAMKVRIRGVGSNANSEPLYIVDGITVKNLSNLDPSEIGSIEVLKDAASASIYGAQGANGVVLVTTKMGKINTAPTINFEAQVGSSSLREFPKLMNAHQYATYLTEAGMPNVPDPNSLSGASTNWMKEVVQAAPLQRYILNISGGTDKSTYLLGGVVSTQQGIIGGPKAQFTRYTLRVNSDHKLKSWLKIGERISYSNKIQTSLPQEYLNSVVGGAVTMDPLTPVTYTGDNLPDIIQDAINNGYKPVTDDNGNYYSIGRYPKGPYSNPLAIIQINNNKNKTFDFAGNAYLEIEPFKGLKFTSKFGVDSYSSNTKNWNPSYWMGPTPANYSTVSTVFVANYTGLNWQFDNFLNYQKTFGNHNFVLLGGMSALKKTQSYMSITGRGLEKEIEDFAEIDFINNSNYIARGNGVSSTLASYYGRMQYDYSGKYLINASIRRDGSSIMSPENKWGTFPAVSVGWVVSNEDFFSALINPSIISSFKLRASWGQNGSISNVRVGDWNTMIRTGFYLNYPINDDATVPGAEPDNLPNYDLKWETSQQTDIGLDLRLFNNRISFSADYFDKKTKDLLTPGVAPGYIGFGMPYVNGGDVSNKGFELELGYRNAEHALKYDVSFNFTHIKNKVTYLNPSYPRIVKGLNRLLSAAFEKDYPIWYFYGYKTDGIFQNQQQIDDYVRDNHLTGYEPKPGDPIIVNTKDDGLISTDDQTYIGSPYPDFTYGMRISLSYKGFDFLAFAQGQAGNEIALVFNRTDYPYTNKLEYWYTNRWTGENSTNSWFRANVDDPFIYSSDMMLFDGSYMRIKQLQLGYTLPENLLKKVLIKNLRIYVSVDDYFTFTKYPGMDPEGGSLDGHYSVDNMIYPVPGKILFGLNVKF